MVGEIPGGVIRRDCPVFAKGNAARGVLAFEDGIGLWLPEARVPLADEAGPVFDVEDGSLVADAEGGRLVSVAGGCEQVNAVVVAGREADGLAFGDEGVGVVGSADCEVELDAVEVDGGGKHFGGESVALGVKTAGGVSVVGA